MELPTIHHKGRKFTFDYRLSELREITKKGINFIALDNTENECLDYALHSGDSQLIRTNMDELSEYKL